MQENQTLHVFRTFLLRTMLMEDDMASCSRAFQKPKKAEEGMKWKVVFKNNFWNDWMVGKQKSSTCVFTTDKSWVQRLQRLDTAVANSTTESFNFWLIKFADWTNLNFAQ